MDKQNIRKNHRKIKFVLEKRILIGYNIIRG